LGDIAGEYFYGTAFFALQFFKQQIVKERKEFLFDRLFVKGLELKVFNL
jgi:hypothetical protein